MKRIDGGKCGTNIIMVDVGKMLIDLVQAMSMLPRNRSEGNVLKDMNNTNASIFVH